MALTGATQVSSGSSSTLASTGFDSVVAAAPISSPWCSHPPPPHASTPPPSTACWASWAVSSRMAGLLVLVLDLDLVLDGSVQVVFCDSGTSDRVARLGVAQHAQ